MADSKAPSGSVSERLIETVRARFPGTTLISGYRRNSITVTGNRSMHSKDKGCAIDIPPKREIFDWIKTNYAGITFELIYSPAGKEQIYKGQPHVYTGAVKATHYNHLHWSVLPENIGGLTGGGSAPVGDTPVGQPAKTINPFTRINEFIADGGARRLTLIGLGLGLIILSVPIVFKKQLGKTVGGLSGIAG